MMNPKYQASADSYLASMPTGALMTRALSSMHMREEFRDSDGECLAAAGCIDAPPLLPAGGWYAVRTAHGWAARGCAMFVGRLA